MTIKCFYHRADFDGVASAAVVLKAFHEAELIPFNYGDPIDYDALDGCDVIMVDCSATPEEMQNISHRAIGFTWIDHHQSAIEKMEAAGLEFQGLRRIGDAGCELAWDYFFTGQERPYAIQLLGRYDVFDLEFDPNVLPFQYGMRSLAESNDPTAELWVGLLSGRPIAGGPAIQAICKRGTVVFEYQTIQDEQAVKSLSFTVEFPDGTRGIACNAGKGSLFFKSMFDKELYDVMAPFYMGRDGLWHVSLYSPQEEGAIDCAKLAQQFDPRGGGHVNAAGFSCEELPWERVEE